MFLALALSHSKALGQSAQLPQALPWLQFAGILQELVAYDHKQHYKIREFLVVAGITLEIKAWGRDGRKYDSRNDSYYANWAPKSLAEISIELSNTPTASKIHTQLFLHLFFQSRHITLLLIDMNPYHKVWLQIQTSSKLRGFGTIFMVFLLICNQAMWELNSSLELFWKAFLLHSAIIVTFSAVQPK